VSRSTGFTGVVRAARYPNVAAVPGDIEDVSGLFRTIGRLFG
jgi:hypothetical protein